MAHMTNQLVTQGQSDSVWNCSKQPGWTKLDITLLRLGVMKFGVGKWKDFLEANLLPNKPVMACYL